MMNLIKKQQSCIGISKSRRKPEKYFSTGRSMSGVIVDISQIEGIMYEKV